MGDIMVPENHTLGIFFAKILGNPEKNVFDILKVKDHPIKVNHNLSVEDFANCCIRYNEQRKESFREIMKLCIFEQQVFLAKGYIDPSFRRRFKGVELADTARVKAICEKARYQYSRVDLSEYDEKIVYDYMWTISVTNRKATCVIGPAEDVINYTCGSVEANPRIVLAKELWRDFNWMVKTGEIVATV